MRFLTFLFSLFVLVFAQSLQAGCDSVDVRVDPAHGYRALVLIDAAAKGTSVTAQTMLIYELSCNLDAWKLAASAPIVAPPELASAQVKIYRVQGLALEHVEENEAAWANAIFLDRAFRFWIGSLEAHRPRERETAAKPTASAVLAVSHESAILLYQAIKNAGRGDALAMPNENERGPDGSAGPRPRGRFSETMRTTNGYRALVAIIDSSRPGAFNAQAAARNPTLLQTLLTSQGG